MSNAQKTPIAQSIIAAAERQVSDAIQRTGRALPASVVSVNGSIVTIKFEVQTQDFTLPNVTVPLFGPEYIRYPIKAGDKGVCVAADARLGGVTGLGGGVAGLTTPANLAALWFMPLGNASWAAPESSEKIEIYGPDGAIVRSLNKKARLDLTDDSATLKYGDNAAVTLTDNSVVFGFGVNNITIDAAGIHLNGPISGNVTGAGGAIDFAGTDLKTSGDIETTAGEVKAGAIGLKAHHHTSTGALAPTTPAQA